MGSVVLFVIPNSWFLIASIGNKPKCFQIYQHMFYYFFQPRTCKAFPACFPLLSSLCTTPATTHRGSDVSYQSLPLACWKVTFVISLSLLLTCLLVWILASVAACTYPGYLFWRPLMDLNKTYCFLSNLAKIGPIFRSRRKLEEESSK